MCFRYLAAKRETNAGAGWLRCEERDKQICRVHDSRSLILNKNFHAVSDFAPTDRHVAVCFKRSVHRVLQNVDEQLLKLRAVGRDRQLSSGPDLDAQPHLETGDATD